MGFVVNIQFGGLCLFLEQADADAPAGTKADGLFAIMPATAAHHHHTPYLVFDAKYEGGPSGVAVVDEIHLATDFTGITKPFAGMGTKRSLHDVMPVSRLAGGRPVLRKYTQNGLEPEVTNRVRLTLGLRVFPCEPIANLRAPKPNSKTDYDFFTGAGRSWVSFEVLDDVKQLQIGKHTLVPDANNEINVGMHDVPTGTVLNPDVGPHWTGMPVPHVEAYYDLVDPLYRPPVESADTGSAPPIPPGIPAGPCGPGSATKQRAAAAAAATASAGSGGGAAPQFIDPYRCTLGGGCEEGDDDC